MYIYYSQSSYYDKVDKFSLKCSKLPFTLVMNYVFIALSSLLSAAGIIKYRAYLYELFWQKQYSYQLVQARVNEEFNFSIPLIKQLVFEANIYW